MAIRIVIGYQWKIPPPPPSPPPVSPSPSCLAAGSMVLMKDLSTKAIEDVVAGDQVVTLNGRGHTVTEVTKTKLGNERRFIVLDSGGSTLRLTDDHDLWILDGPNQGWGTHNHSWWLFESIEEGLDNPLIRVLNVGEYYDFATEFGWVKTYASPSSYQDPEEVVYGLELDGGAGFVADGFVVIADYAEFEDYESVRWNGV